MENRIHKMIKPGQKMLISDFVFDLRNGANLSVFKFAGSYNISTSLVKKYESGEYDSPTALIASNFCKNFNLTPSEFVDKFEFSTNGSINTDEFLNALKLYYNSLPTNFDSVESIKNLLGLSTFSRYIRFTDDFGPEAPYDVIFEDENSSKIAGKYFKYEKVHTNQNIFDAYSDLFNSILYAASMKFSFVGLGKLFTTNKFLFVTPSKNAFNAIYNIKNEFLYQNDNKSNIILLLLPKNNSTKYYYFNVIGEDFLERKDNIFDGTLIQYSPNE